MFGLNTTHNFLSISLKQFRSFIREKKKEKQNGETFRNVLLNNSKQRMLIYES